MHVAAKPDYSRAEWLLIAVLLAATTGQTEKNFLNTLDDHKFIINKGEGGGVQKKEQIHLWLAQNDIDY